MSNLPANVQNITQGLTRAAARISNASESGGQYLRLAKSGEWVYGADDVEVEEGALFALNPATISEGFIAWPEEGGAPVGEEMRTIYEDPIQRGELPDVGAKWNEQVAFEAVCINGEDEGQTFIYKASSLGGRKEFAALLRSISAQYEANPGDPAVVPIIELGVDSYKHNQYGKIFTPVFEIKKWATMDDTPSTVEPEAKVEPELAPEAPRRRRKRAR